MNIRSRTAVVVFIIVAASGAYWGTLRVAAAQDTGPRPDRRLAEVCTGVLGLTRTQTARLNVLNEGDSNLVVEIVFRAANSTILSHSGVVVIPPDEGAFFDLDGAAVVGERERLPLYGMVFFRRQRGTVEGPNVTFELFNRDTLVTDAVIGAGG